MFSKQLSYSTAPSTALTEARTTLTDGDAVANLLQAHYGYGQWKVTFPGEVRLSQEICDIFEVPYSPDPAPLEFLIGLYHPDDRGKLLALIAAALQETRGFHCVLRIK